MLAAGRQLSYRVGLAVAGMLAASSHGVAETRDSALVILDTVTLAPVDRGGAAPSRDEEGGPRVGSRAGGSLDATVTPVAVPLPRPRPDAGSEAAIAADVPDGAVVAALVPRPPPRPLAIEAAPASPGDPDEAPAVAPVVPSVAGAGGDGLRALVARHASINGIPTALADAVVKIESRYDPRARNGAFIGLMQISLPTARSLGYGGGAAGLSDAETNLTYGVRYLAQAYRLAGGDTCRTVMKFQGGHRAATMTQAARTTCTQVLAYAAQFR